jgi:hypothetical protein
VKEIHARHLRTEWGANSMSAQHWAELICGQAIMYRSDSSPSFGPRSHSRFYFEPEKIYPSTPLGRPRHHIRYIRPAPPTYVTEYEINSFGIRLSSTPCS